jgi:hypothetical protein
LSAAFALGAKPMLAKINKETSADLARLIKLVE